MTREYGQYCGLARALDLIGSRWSLLIVRELLPGPRRFTDLEQSLPGIPTNILSARLRELEDVGVIERSLQPRPMNVVAYGLTPYGKALEKPLLSLGLWGALSLGPPKPGDALSPGSLTFALKAMFQHDTKGEHSFQIRAGDDGLNVYVSDGEVSFPTGPDFEPEIIFEVAPDVLLRLLRGYDDLDTAIDTGCVRIHGSQIEARRFFEIFRLPSLETVS